MAMRFKRHGLLAESAMKRVTTRPPLSSLCARCRRRFASTSATYPESIAVLGGGISGLASAFFAAKEFPKSRITVFESKKGPGGWIQSRRVDVPGGNVLFENGPRTLKPSVRPTMHLIQELGLCSDVVYTPSNAPAASNRYIYYPDRINRIPVFSRSVDWYDVFRCWRSGLLAGVYTIPLEGLRPGRPTSMTDESIGSFLSRRLDKRVANNLFSAVMHGIYAGDIWQLSARSLLTHAWQLEGRYGSVLSAFQRLNRPTALHQPYQAEQLVHIKQNIKIDDDFALANANASTFTFFNGLQTLIQRLHETLEKNEQIDIKFDSPVQSYNLKNDGSQQVEVTVGNEQSSTSHNFDSVISTLRNESLTPYVTVMTVSLYYSAPSLTPSGFGYLIPQSVPFEQNPERALGVIFDSWAAAGQDNVESPGTKVTVMLGGHYWDGWSGYPDSEEGLKLAKSLLSRHLKITDEPIVYNVDLKKDCIPQYTVGYEDRLKQYASAIRDDFKGKLRVIGNQYNSVGVNDCISAAWRAIFDMRGNGWKNPSRVGPGLDKALDEREWVEGNVAPYGMPPRDQR